jgi:hypothetical protein
MPRALALVLVGSPGCAGVYRWLTSAAGVSDLDSEGGVGALGAFFCGPLEEFCHAGAGRGLAGGAEGMGGARAPHALGSLGERAGSVGGLGAVIGHEVHASLLQYREPLRRGAHRDVVAGFSGSGRFHAVSYRDGRVPMTVTALGTPGDCRSVRDRERARAGTSRGGYRTASRGDAEGRPERAFARTIPMDRLREHIKIADRTVQQGRPELTVACPHGGYDSAYAPDQEGVMARPSSFAVPPAEMPMGFGPLSARVTSVVTGCAARLAGQRVSVTRLGARPLPGALPPPRRARRRGRSAGRPPVRRRR